MPFSRSVKLLAVISLLTLGACDAFKQDEPQPRVGSLTQTLTMVDNTGKVYGTVQLDPINGGKVFDADGRLIGRVVTPTPGALAPGVQ